MYFKIDVKVTFENHSLKSIFKSNLENYIIKRILKLFQIITENIL